MQHCLESNEEVLVHGANGVCGPPAPSARGLVGWAVVAALALVLLGRRARRRWLIALVLAAALPGLWCIVARRADRPGHADAVVAAPRALDAALRRYAAPFAGCVTVRDRCVACEPIVRFALPPAASCAAPGSVVIEPDALSRGCRSVGGQLVCGEAAP